MNAGGQIPSDPALSVVPEPGDAPESGTHAEALEDNLRSLRDDVEDAAEESMQYLLVRVVPILLGLFALWILTRRRRKRRRAQRVAI